MSSPSSEEPCGSIREMLGDEVTAEVRARWMAIQAGIEARRGRSPVNWSVVQAQHAADAAARRATRAAFADFVRGKS